VTKKNYQPNISILRSHKFLQMLKMVDQSIASSSSSHRETCIRTSSVFTFNLFHKWLLIAFCLENVLSQIAILDGMSITSCQSCISLGQFVCHSKLLPHVCQTSNRSRHAFKLATSFEDQCFEVCQLTK
jgi:hypothetical protein